MEKIKLRHTELDVSRVCFGTMTFGSQVNEVEARKIVGVLLRPRH